ncbi:MAG: penicillin-binding protein 1B [Vibrio sp.]
MKYSAPKKSPSGRGKSAANSKDPQSGITATRRRKTTAKKPTKGGKKAKSPRKRKKQVTWKGRLWGIFWKLALVGIVLAAALGFYLNSLVTQRFSGQLFSIPTVVYARIMNLQVGASMSESELLQELDVLNYKKVTNPDRAGEYSVSNDKVELIRRPFEFADGPEAERHLLVNFDQKGIERIQSLDPSAKGDLGFVRLEPKMLGSLEAGQEEQRLFLKREQFPDAMVEALLATEDKHFYQHHGVSPVGIARALVANIKAGRTVQGGSTLTQQLAKNLFLTRERSLWRKIKEAYIALIIDYRYSKDRILEAYLNEVYLGQNGNEAIHGFALASRYYFGVPIDELRIDQMALLVGMVKGPSYYNPKRYPERTKTRRDLVLKLMMEQEILTPDQYSQAVKNDLGIQQNLHMARRQPAYFEQLSNELKEKVGDKFTPDSGLRVFTTLDPVSQSYLEKAVRVSVPKLEARVGEGLQTASVAVDRQTGEIRAMVGGKQAGFDGYNRALHAKRQIGSLAKPSVYLTALQNPEKFNLATTLEDKPVSIKSSNGQVWKPQNYDRKFRGQVPLYLGMAKSLNIPTVNLGMQVGTGAVVDTLEKLGVPRDEINPVPSMFLGSYGLTPYQAAQMFQTITNSGRRATLTALRNVVDKEGEIIYRSLPKASQQVPEQAAWLTTYIMKKVVTEGTGRSLQAKYGKALLAAKTGTSNDSRDSWFVGVDGREVVTIWTGRDDNKPMKLTGASGSLRTYDEYLSLRKPQRLSLPWPKGVTTAKYRSSNGELVFDCSGSKELPVWDDASEIQKRCNQPKQKPQQEASDWFQSLFD